MVQDPRHAARVPHPQPSTIAPSRRAPLPAPATASAARQSSDGAEDSTSTLAMAGSSQASKARFGFAALAMTGFTSQRKYLAIIFFRSNDTLERALGEGRALVSRPPYVNHTTAYPRCLQFFLYILAPNLYPMGQTLRRTTSPFGMPKGRNSQHQ